MSETTLKFPVTLTSCPVKMADPRRNWNKRLCVGLQMWPVSSWCWGTWETRRIMRAVWHWIYMGKLAVFSSPTTVWRLVKMTCLASHGRGAILGFCCHKKPQGVCVIVLCMKYSLGLWPPISRSNLLESDDCRIHFVAHLSDMKSTSKGLNFILHMVG